MCDRHHHHLPRLRQLSFVSPLWVEPYLPPPLPSRAQESTRHSEALDTITTYLGYGSYLSWSEEEKCAWLTKVRPSAGGSELPLPNPPHNLVPWCCHCPPLFYGLCPTPLRPATPHPTPPHQELDTRRPLVPSDMPMSDDVREVRRQAAL